MTTNVSLTRLLAGSAATALLALAAPVQAHDGAPHKHDDQTAITPNGKGQDAAPKGAADADAADDSAPAMPAADGNAPIGQGAPKSKPVPTPVRRKPPPQAVDEQDDEEVKQRVISDSDWRQRNRIAPTNQWLDPSHFVAELRFAPYSWEVGDSGIDPNFFSDTYGAEPSTSFYFGLELDWLPLNVPYVGSFGAAFGWGFATISAPLATASGDVTETESSFTIFPMHASAVFRMDGLLRKFGIPIVPHAKFGFGFTPWSQSDDAEDAPEALAARGSGVSAGLHWALGASLALNTFDQSAARAMYEDTGIRYTYIWAEWMRSDMGTLGKDNQLRVGTSTVALGLAIDW